MNTNSKLPTKLHRALSAVKNYLDRCPHGTSLEMARKKVSNLSTLNSKELAQLVEHLGERESVHVFRLSPKGGDASKGRQYLMLKRFGEPAVPDGFDIWPKREAIEPEDGLTYTQRRLMEHIQSNPFKRVSLIARDQGKTARTDVIAQAVAQLRRPEIDEIQEVPLTEGEQVSRNAPQVAPAATITKSATQMRNEAAELLRLAEEADRTSEQNDFFNKRLGPVKLEVLQASNKIRQHLDGLIDGMAELEKACSKLKELAA